MENRFYKSRNINKLSSILDRNGFTELHESITDPLLDKSLIFDSEMKTYFIISEDLLESAKFQITEGLNEALHDYDKFNAEHFQPKQDENRDEYVWVDKKFINQLASKTLRDEFAIAAVQGELSTQTEDYTVTDFDKLSKHAYMIADAMLKARNNKNK